MIRTRPHALPTVLLVGLLFLSAPGGCNRPSSPADRGARPGQGNATRRKGDNPAEAPPVAVRVEAVRRGPISYSLTTTGDLQAEEWTDLVVRRTGIVEELRVEEGTPVRSGEILLVLDRRESEIVLDEARTGEKEAAQRAELAREAVKEAQNAVEQSRIAAEQAETEYRRYRRLSRGVVQQEEMESRAYQMKRTKLALDGSKNELRQARINAAIAETAARAAELKRKKAEIDHDFTQLKAPFDGVISLRHVQRGQYLGANQRAFTLVNTNNLKLEVNLPQRYLLLLRPGLQVSLENEAFEGRSFPAVLERVSPVVGEKGTIKVTIRVQQKDLRLRPGMYVSARIIIDTHEDALLASKRGVQYDTLDGIPYVFAVRSDRAVKLPVKIGYRTSTTLEVIPLSIPGDFVSGTPGFRFFGATFYRPSSLSALGADDRLIVAGQDKLRGGEAVKVVAADGSPSPPVRRGEEPKAGKKAGGSDATRGDATAASRKRGSAPREP
jgi:membrane fusion protein (multidrug efflux system)